ncbi:MAG: hypothetical protein JKY19_02225 [Alcanivoracaceae bacterium]|nr:hypothetical protein [Alcanivoracaceae bacterium]
MASGYFHENYAQSVKEKVQTIHLEKSCGWLLKRKIPKSDLFDAINCYPLLCCKNWEHLQSDIDNIPKNIISISIVSDPFSDLDMSRISTTFDLIKKFKQHYIVDLTTETNFSPHHKREIRRAYKKNIDIKYCNNPLEYLDTWNNLYKRLISKHNIRGNTAFSKALFVNQFNIPGLLCFRAEINGEVVGMVLWYTSNKNAYYHLTAYSDSGYKNGASYALMNYSISFLKKLGIKLATLGAGAGLTTSANDGLSQFKSGWSHYTKPVYFLGKINNRTDYHKMISMAQSKTSSFFPAYRQTVD